VAKRELLSTINRISNGYSYYRKWRIIKKTANRAIYHLIQLLGAGLDILLGVYLKEMK
jgi:hypothetical protein